jgi:hypothetical protein
MYSKLEEFGFDKINEMIPHEYVDGKNHGKREGKGSIFDLRVDAGGLEAQMEELKDRYCWRRLKTDHPYRLKIDQGELLNSVLYSIGIVDQTELVLLPFSC